MNRIMVIIFILSVTICIYAEGLMQLDGKMIEEISLADFEKAHLSSYKQVKEVSFPFRFFCSSRSSQSGDFAIGIIDDNNKRQRVVNYYDKQGNLYWQKKLPLDIEDFDINISPNGSIIIVSYLFYEENYGIQVAFDKSGKELFRFESGVGSLVSSPDGKYFYPGGFSLSYSCDITQADTGDRTPYFYNTDGKKIPFSGVVGNFKTLIRYAYYTPDRVLVLAENKKRQQLLQFYKVKNTTLSLIKEALIDTMLVPDFTASFACNVENNILYFANRYFFDLDGNMLYSKPTEFGHFSLFIDPENIVYETRHQKENEEFKISVLQRNLKTGTDKILCDNFMFYNNYKYKGIETPGGERSDALGIAEKLSNCLVLNVDENGQGIIYPSIIVEKNNWEQLRAFKYAVHKFEDLVYLINYDTKKVKIYQEVQP